MSRSFLFWGFKSSNEILENTLGTLERDVMEIVWNRDEISVRDVCAQLASGVAYTTVMTIMDRLYHKGFLTRRLQSRAHYYEPAIEYAAVRDEAVEALIRNFFGSREKLREFLDDASDEFVPTATTAQRVTPPALDETLL